MAISRAAEPFVKKIPKSSCGFCFLAGHSSDEAALTGRTSFFDSGRETRGKGCKASSAAIALLLCLLSAVLCDVTWADEPLYDIDIPSMNAADALSRFAEQTGAIMLFPYDLASARRANEVRGRYTLLQGLQLLLEGTGLSGGLSNKRVVNITRVEDERHNGEERGMLDHKESLKKRFAAFFASVFSMSAASGQQTDAAAQGLEEVVVTAQKRTQNVQDVPISISAIDGRQLENFSASQLTDVAAYIAGVQVDSGGTPGQTTISLRGISALATNGAPTVGSYIDDTPLGASSNFAQANSLSLDLLPFEIERIEVLRGPQGTLYGASTLGGLIKYVTREPDLDQLSFRAGADAFGISHAHSAGWAGRAAANVPLVEGKAALTASYAYRTTPGYIDNPVLGVEDQNDYTQRGGRLSFLWQAWDNVSVRLSGMWQSIDADNDANIVLDATTQRPLGEGRTNLNRFAEPFEKDVAYFGATVNWELGWADVVSATSYSESTTDRFVDFTDIFGPLLPLFGAPPGLSTLATDLELKKWTQEFRLVSASGERLEWLVGLFYTDEDSKNVQRFSALFLDGTPMPGLDPLAFGDLPSTYREYAAFGNLTYAFTDRLAVTVGVRWAENDQTFTQNSSGVAVPTGSLTNEASEDVITWSFSPQFHVNDSTMLYARAASGYRPGGPNFPMPGAPPSVDADSLVNYELGVKTEFWNRRALVDLTLFTMDWEDIQLSFQQGGVSFLDNAGTARSRGGELTSVFMPLQGLRLGFNAAYTDATLTEDAPSLSGVSGDRLPRIPKWSASVTAAYDFPLRSGWLGQVGGGIRYVDDRLSLVESSPRAVTADSYSALDLNANISNERWTLKLYALNVTDEDAILTSNRVTSALGQPVSIVATPLQPRTVGLALDVRF